MNKFWIIVSHTYMSRLKTKMFYISTILTLLFITLMVNFESIVDTISGEDDRNVAVIDDSGELIDSLSTSVEASNLGWEITSYTQSVEEGKEAVKEGDFSALVTLSLNEEGFPEATYYANNIADSELQTDLQQQLQQLKISIATKKAGLDQETIGEIYEPITFHSVSLDLNGKSEEELNQARGIVYAMLILLYMAVLMYGTLIATDVASEKSSRVMEILVSSASPVTHMFAKIVGIALLGLTQIAIFVGVAFGMLQTKQDGAGGLLELFGFHGASISILLYGVLFFILGYLLYATLAAMLGSLVSRVEEVNQMITPMMLLIVIAFMLAMFGINVPESTVVTVTSYIPFFAPMLMFIRVGILDVAMWEVLLSVGILAATILLFAFIGARVYKGGVLLYGKSSSLKDIKKAIVLSKKE
jgi:ABC-2 type transport system permease protein